MVVYYEYMNYLVVGLGNPGEEYSSTRHNVGRMFVETFQKMERFPEWEFSKSAKALYTDGKLGKYKVELILPETYMNLSGKAVGYAAKKHDVKKEQVIVVHDDVDLPFGTFKLSFNRGTAGHNGVESVKKTLKSKAFVRVRVGVCPTTPGGKLRKPQGAEAVVAFLLKSFTPKEREMLKKTGKRVSEALATCVTEGHERAMNLYN